LREEADRLAVLEGLKDGTIDCIATDHAPHSSLDKNVEFNLAAFGIVGLETSLGLVLTMLVEPGLLNIGQAVRLLSCAPALAFNLKGKGSLKPGSDADLVLVDPKEAWEVDPEKFFSKSRNTPFTGMKLKGKVKRTMVAGNWVFTS
jgi:dihydroorotase